MAPAPYRGVRRLGRVAQVRLLAGVGGCGVQGSGDGEVKGEGLAVAVDAAVGHPVMGDTSTPVAPIPAGSAPATLWC